MKTVGLWCGDGLRVVVCFRGFREWWRYYIGGVSTAVTGTLGKFGATLNDFDCCGL